MCEMFIWLCKSWNSKHGYDFCMNLGFLYDLYSVIKYWKVHEIFLRCSYEFMSICLFDLVWCLKYEFWMLVKSILWHFHLPQSFGPLKFLKWTNRNKVGVFLEYTMVLSRQGQVPKTCQSKTTLTTQPNREATWNKCPQTRNHHYNPEGPTNIGDKKPYHYPNQSRDELPITHADKNP